MKVEVQTHINPVVITLETQEEIDTLYALLNNAPVFRALEQTGTGNIQSFKELRTELRSVKSDGYSLIHESLCKIGDKA